MNQEIKKKWVDALRSGKYKQGKGTLRFNDKYCCLGVLTDLYIKSNNREWTDKHSRVDDNSDYYNVYEFEGTLSVLSESVKNWAGLKSNCPSVDYKCGNPLSTRKLLVELNDQDTSFVEIANIIDKQL